MDRRLIACALLVLSSCYACAHDGQTVTVDTRPAHATPPPDTMFIMPLEVPSWYPLCVETVAEIPAEKYLICVTAEELRAFVALRQRAD